MEPADERRLDAGLLAGDAEAFGQFYARHEDFVLALFVRRVGAGNAELAADLAAETFACALASRANYDESRGEPRAWLYGIARHVLADSLSRGQVQDRVRLRLRLERLYIDDEAIARIGELTGSAALDALEGLPPDQQLAVRGRVLDEAGYDDLARALRCSPSVARKRVSRGLLGAAPTTGGTGMRIPELQRILVEGARLQERPARRWMRLGRRPLVALFGVLAVGGSAAAAVVSLSTSRPLSGTVPVGVGVLHTAGPTRYRISVFPYLTVGWSGWCASANFSVHSRPTETEYSCGPVESSGQLVLNSALFGARGGFYEYEILSDRVAAVHYSDGPTITPVSDPRLPRGTRAVVRVGVVPRLGKRGTPVAFPREKWLDARGRVLPMPVIDRANAVEHLPLRTLDPRHPSGGGCAVLARALPGLVALTQTVVRAVPWPRREPGAFLACANATYRLGTSSLAVAVLVDATNPARRAPALPGLVADPANPGVLIGAELGSIGFPQGLGVFAEGRQQPFDTPTAHQALADHDVSARRAARGWLVAEGGTAAQRATLLGALSTDARGGAARRRASLEGANADNRAGQAP